MKSAFQIPAVCALIIAFLTSCGHDFISDVGANADSPVASKSENTPGMVVGSANGYRLPEPPNTVLPGGRRTITVDAKLYADGTVEGTVQTINHGWGYALWEVECLAIDYDRSMAAILAVITEEEHDDDVYPFVLQVGSSYQMYFYDGAPFGEQDWSVVREIEWDICQNGVPDAQTVYEYPLDYYPQPYGDGEEEIYDVRVFVENGNLNIR